MADDKNNEDDSISDIWIWENQCYEEMDSQANFEAQLQQEKELTYQKLWHLFQNAATCVAHLHKGSQGSVDRNIRWTPFQTAAGSVTALYKESADGVRRCTELGMLHGHQRRNKELLGWLRRRRGVVRREELLSFLTGRTPPLRGVVRNTHRWSPRPHPAVHGADRTSPRPPSARRHQLQSTAVHPSPADAAAAAGGLPIPFRDPLALNSLQGAMSAVSVGLQTGVGGGFAQRRRSPQLRRASGSTYSGDQNSAAHVKRPSTPVSPADVTMDSPTHKRARYT